MLSSIIISTLTGVVVFRVPTTRDVLTSLFHPLQPKSNIDFLNLLLLACQVVLFLVLPSRIAKPFFFAYFVLWRAAYDGGLGWILTKQSKRRWIVKEIQRRGWLDPERRPKVWAWIGAELKGKMGSDYAFEVRGQACLPRVSQLIRIYHPHRSCPSSITRGSCFANWLTSFLSSTLLTCRAQLTEPHATLCSDFLSYCLFAFSCFQVPAGHPLPFHILR